MFDFIRNDLRNKLLLLLIANLAMILLVVYLGITSLRGVIADYGDAVNNDVAYLTKISALNISFKTQVQEWKNTLIRGKDNEQREKYWNRFLTRAEEIQNGYQQLLTSLPSSHPSFQDVTSFSKSYPKMMAAYKNGFDEFIRSDFDIAVADKFVSGIDRAPTAELNAALQKTNDAILNLSSEIEQKAESTSLTTRISVIAVILISIILIAWFINRKILTPLNSVTVLSKRVADGDFTNTISITTKDQISHLAKNFNLIQSDLSAVLAQLFKELDTLGLVIKTLTASGESVGKRLDRQSEQTVELNRKINELRTLSDSISSLIIKANKFVSVSSEQANDGQSKFKTNVQTSKTMLAATNNAAAIIQTLKKDTDDIGSFVEVINGIAEQTNLLALNAAIEAARAGESGRGFAVVADEVRTLANKTQLSTKQISDNIAKLQQAADNAVEAMNTGRDQAQLSVQQTVESQDFIDQLHDAFSQITGLNHAVSVATNDQITSSQQVVDEINSIRTSASDSQKQVVEMKHATKELSEVFKQINGSINHFKIQDSAYPAKN